MKPTTQVEEPLHIRPLGLSWFRIWCKAVGLWVRLGALRYGYRLSRCGQKLLTSAQFSVERLVELQGGSTWGKAGGGNHLPRPCPSTGFFFVYSFHSMEFFILWDISVFEIAYQLLTLDKKNHTHVIPKGRMS